ncbi:MAG TPA: Gfo/Idh/MocA family oxidoreductase [Opitutales bacterium]|nr:Gfo/Idh/MocA family oxidoreductase [Opitutales bacterium]
MALSGRFNNHPNRRQFLKTSTFALAGAALAKPLAWTSQSAAPTASASQKRLGVALIGCGSYGGRLLRECLQNHVSWQIDFPAVCDVWRPQSEAAADAIESATGKRPKIFSRYSDVLAMDEVDCVIIATPDFSHTSILVAAAYAGKQIYVEKPLAISLEQADAALNAVLQNNTILQVGTQFRSLPQFAEAARLVQDGALGKILKVDTIYNRKEFRWDQRDTSDVDEKDVDWEQFLMQLPPRPFDARQLRMWRLYRDYTAGITGLLGTHVIDIAHWLTDSGPPVSATGIEAWLIGQESETADFQECLFTYENGMVLNSSCRSGNSEPRSQINFYGTKGTLHCPFSTGATLTLSPDGASDDDPVEAREIRPAAAPGHLENWFDCIRKGTTKTNADIYAGYAHAVTATLATQSAREGRRIHFEPSTKI